MGIHKFLNKFYPTDKFRSDDLSELKGLRVGIDAHVILHRALGSPEAARQFHTLPPVPVTHVRTYFRKFLQKLIKEGCTPVVVTDGANHPMKHAKHERDRERLAGEEQLRKLLAARRAQYMNEVLQKMKKTTFVRSDVIAVVKEVCEELRVEIYGAPYEADWQLISMERQGLVDCLMTVDSDFIVLGAQCVCFHFLMANSKCFIYRANDAHLDTQLDENIRRQNIIFISSFFVFCCCFWGHESSLLELPWGGEMAGPS
jgi:exonuclease-1